MSTTVVGVNSGMRGCPSETWLRNWVSNPLRWACVSPTYDMNTQTGFPAGANKIVSARTLFT